ncbi:hypothetical protein CN941_30755 [Bacillus cereus]|uniref:Uncharacterized protein n=1 Tax=Bacillus cereus TaxID=1396 RepID=A0A2B9ML13_BACCE|nr:hypothetical protein CN527_02125 [Bacillus cereus]PFE66663.1 hypothetical protein CN316_21565 [Bacillus cereus]PFU39503.1 hypothetical protein COK86_22160 [Bacillus cereus]PGL32038.1 hypothetical protein CN930_23580 [Bacillus cereus]PGM28340.1 hypothetical protein CN941_30755 [Bacillus cereus]
MFYCIRYLGLPPVFRKKTTLKACKILCEKSGDIGNYREAKRRAKIGMYKKMHSIIEKEKGGFLVRLGFCHVLATDNETLC